MGASASHSNRRIRALVDSELLQLQVQVGRPLQSPHPSHHPPHLPHLPQFPPSVRVRDASTASRTVAISAKPSLTRVLSCPQALAPLERPASGAPVTQLEAVYSVVVVRAGELHLPLAAPLEVRQVYCDGLHLSPGHHWASSQHLDSSLSLPIPVKDCSCSRQSADADPEW